MEVLVLVAARDLRNWRQLDELSYLPHFVERPSTAYKPRPKVIVTNARITCLYV
jgi:hypothetical protein